MVQLTSRTEDFPLLWEPMTVIWGRSFACQLALHTDTDENMAAYDVVGDTDRRKHILKLGIVSSHDTRTLVLCLLC